MLPITKKDFVVRLDKMPKPDVGAPSPLVMSNEHTILLAYFVSQPDPDWDGTYVSLLGPDTPGQTVALVQFRRYCSYTSGAPNDEAFSGHPLYSRGLRPHAVFEVQDSSWIHRLERMNAVHPRHMPALFADYRHFIFAFHDSTFECVAEEITVTLYKGTFRSVISEMEKLLEMDSV